MADEGVVIRCFRTDNPEVLAVPGMQKIKCVNCQFDVWISPSGLKIMEKMEARIICNVCLDPKPQDDAGLPILPLNNEQIDEIKDGLWNKKTRN